MTIELFKVFLTAAFPELYGDLEDEEIKLVYRAWGDYLNTLPKELVDSITPSSIGEVILGLGNPLRTKGFHPALIAHFHTFLKNFIEEDVNEDVYYFTFGQSHVDEETGESLKDYWVEVEGDFHASRDKMTARFGYKWSHQYSEADFIPSFFPKGRFLKL